MTDEDRNIMRHRAQADIGKAMRQKINELKSQGMSNADVARELEISEDRVHAVLEIEGKFRGYLMSITAEKQYQPTSSEISEAVRELIWRKIGDPAPTETGHFEVDIMYEARPSTLQRIERMEAAGYSETEIADAIGIIATEVRAIRANNAERGRIPEDTPLSHRKQHMLANILKEKGYSNASIAYVLRINEGTVRILLQPEES